MSFIAIICTAAAACLALTVRADNILANPGFETGTFSGWTAHTTESWSMGPNTTLNHSGTHNLWMQGLYGNGGAPTIPGYISYAYQTIACYPGSTFSADAWFSQWVSGYPSEGGSGNGSGIFGANMSGNPQYFEDGWVEVLFLDATNNTLAVFRSAIIDPQYVNNLVSIGAMTTNIVGTNTYINLNWIDFAVTNQYDISTITNINQDPSPNNPNFPGTSEVITNTLAPGQYMVAPPGTKNVQFRLVLFQASYCSGAPHWDDCVLNQVSGPSASVIGNLSPDGTKFFNAANTNFTFTVVSASTGGFPLPTNPQAGIKVVVNGVDQSGSLLFNGSPTNWNVALPNLTPSALFNISITASNSAGLISSASVSFDTFPTNCFIVSSEDYDFTNGNFIQDPLPTSAPATNSYYGLGGTYAYDVSTYRLADGTFGGLPGGSSELYRSDGFVAFQYTTDVQLPLYAAQGVGNVALAYNNGGNWENYTRIYPSGYYKVYARMSGGAGVGREFLNVVTNGLGTALQQTNNLGEFYIQNGTDWNKYNWIPLTYGDSANLVSLNLPGGQQTMQLSSGGGNNTAFFILVPLSGALGIPPFISNLSLPAQPVFVQATNVTFSVFSLSSTIQTGHIYTYLNGVNVSSLASYAAVGTGNTNWTVSVPVPQDQVLNLVIGATDANGLSNSTAVLFDTFGTSYFTIEAEDFDFNGGQFITNPIPTGAVTANGTPQTWAYAAANSYFYFPSNDPANAAITNVDLTTPINDDGELFRYRPNESCGTEVTTDYLRGKFYVTNADTSVTIFNDFNVGWWDPGTWVNYTRSFPTNQYFVYGRLASGNGAYTMTLSQVISGVGTSNQTTQLLGTFADPNPNGGWQNWDWVPLTDAHGKPVTVSLGGVATLRATSVTGQNANYYMFVPAIQAVNLTASISGNNILLKFPTPQTNVTYTVLYSSSLSGGSWQALSSVVGDGTTKTVTDTLGSKQYYKLLIQ